VGEDAKWTVAMCRNSYLANQNLSDRGVQPASKNRPSAPDLFFARVVHPRSDLCILPARDQPVPLALHKKERQPMVSAEIPAPVWENKTLHVMSEDGNSRILGGEPYDNCSNVAVGIFEHMLVDPGGSAPVLRLPMPPAPCYIYPVGVIGEQHQNRIRVVFVPSVPKVCHYFTNSFFIVRIMSGNDIGRSDYAGHQQ
jgi:hypothetical protein